MAQLNPPNPERLLTFRSGGWVLLLAGALTLIAGAFVLMPAFSSRGSRATGDGHSVESYQFDLSTCLIPRDQLVGSGFPKDGLPAMTDPLTITLQEFNPDEKLGGVRKLRASERVIGVNIAGESRAYPIWILAWHEVVNDTLGGVPIVVTYNPLCDAAVVLSRRVGGEPVTFGVSGLLYNSNLLMYDRRPGGKNESLWCPLQFRAVAGPAAAAGEIMPLVPAVVMRWQDWQKLHPDTTLLRPDPARIQKLYRNDAYTSYYGSDLLRFPVEPLPGRAGGPYKTPLLAVRAAERWRILTLPDLAGRAGARGFWQTTIDQRPVRFEYRPDPPTAWVIDEADGRPVDSVSAFWFAWYSMHPDEVDVVPARPQGP